MALRFVGSAIATMSELPVRETGMTLCFSHSSFGTSFSDLGVDLVLLEVDRRDAVLLREEVGDLVVADVPELGERVAEVRRPTSAARPGLPELREGDELLADEELAQPVRVCHPCPLPCVSVLPDAGRTPAIESP